MSGARAQAVAQFGTFERSFLLQKNRSIPMGSTALICNSIIGNIKIMIVTMMKIVAAIGMLDNMNFEQPLHNVTYFTWTRCDKCTLSLEKNMHFYTKLFIEMIFEWKKNRSDSDFVRNVRNQWMLFDVAAACHSQLVYILCDSTMIEQVSSANNVCISHSCQCQTGWIYV